MSGSEAAGSIGSAPVPTAQRVRGWLIELAHFTQKEARACAFAGLFFAAVLFVPRGGVLGLPRYDLLLLIALAIQAWLL